MALVFTGSTAHSVTKESQAELHYHVGKWEHTDTALISAFDIMTRIKNPQRHTEQSHTLNASVCPHSLLSLLWRVFHNRASGLALCRSYIAVS